MNCFEIISLAINFFIMIAGFSALGIYLMQKKDVRKSAATLIVDEIEMIERTIKMLRSKEQLNPVEVFKSKSVLGNNQWSHSKHLLSKKLGVTNTKLIDEFYCCAEEVEKARKSICHGLTIAWEAKELILQAKIAEASDLQENEREYCLERLRQKFVFHSEIFNPQVTIDILLNNLKNMPLLIGTTAYEKIRKMSYYSKIK